jgi:predicted GIY-YIG superfamily endonuclease
VGWSRQLDRRLAHHAAGTGANFLRVVREAGLTWTLARVWEGQDRAFERKLKDTHRVRIYCPLCAKEKVRTYRPKENATRVAPPTDAHNACNACDERT